MGGPGLREGGKSCNGSGKGWKVNFLAKPDPLLFSSCYYFYTCYRLKEGGDRKI